MTVVTENQLSFLGLAVPSRLVLIGEQVYSYVCNMRVGGFMAESGREGGRARERERERQEEESIANEEETLNPVHYTTTEEIKPLTAKQRPLAMISMPSSCSLSPPMINLSSSPPN